MENDDRSEQDFRDHHGQVQIWTGYAPSTIPISIKNHEITTIALGASHVVFLTKDGLVFSFGNGGKGQLGIGALNDFVKPPQQLHCLNDKKIINVVCGARHSGAVCANGDLYMWGDSSSGQCALNLDCIPEPKKVIIIQPAYVCIHSVRHDRKMIKVQQVSCGDTHTLALSNRHEVWTWGFGVQLGLTRQQEKSYKPCRIDFLLGRRVLMIACGSQHSVAILEKLPRSDRAVADPTNIITHQFDVSTCSQCHQDYYTCLDIGDAVVINDIHVCPLGLQVENNGNPKQYVSAKPEKNLTRQSNDMEINQTEMASKIGPQILGKEVKISQQIENPTNCPLLPSSENYLAVNTNSIRNSDLELISLKTIDKVQVLENEEPNIIINNNNNVGTKVCHNSVSDSDITSNFTSDLLVCNKNPIPSSSSFSNTTDTLNEFGSPKKRNCSFLNSSSTKEFLAKQLSTLHDGSAIEQELLPDADLTSTGLKSPIYHNKAVTAVKNTVDKFSFVSKSSLDSPSSSQESLELTEIHTLEKRTFSHLKNCKLTPSLSQQLSEDSLCNMDHFSSHSFRNLSASHVLLDTEVWTWGKGDLGQLGHGDTLDRPQPCNIKMLSSKSVVKVAVGANHTLALTSNSQVYSWGSNIYGQLCHQESPTFTPHPIKLMSGTLIWDIAAGSHHSLLIADGIGFQSGVYYCGKQYSEKSQEKQTTQPSRLTFLKENAWVRRISAGGMQNGCITDQNVSGLVATLHEFAASERNFHYHLSVLKQTVLEKVSTSGHIDSPPKQGCDWLRQNSISKSLAGFESLDKLVTHVKTALPYAFASIESSSYGFTLKALFDSLFHLTHTVGVNCTELTRLLQDMGDITSLLMFAHPDEYISVFKLYCKSFFDTIAMNGLEYWIKSLGSPFDQCREKLVQLLSDMKMEQKTFSDILLHLLKIPVLRLREYERLIEKLTMHFDKEPVKCKLLKDVAFTWESLKNMMNSEQSAAEQTKAFWDSCPPKFGEIFKTPSRRILLDSKKKPLTILNSGRFSSHWLLLCNDAFIHIQFSSYQVYNLAALWVDPLQDTDILQNALLITTPEDVFTVYTATPQSKAEWLCALNQAINKELANQRKNFTASQRLIPPLIRNASHLFTKNLTYKDAKYDGMFLCGKMEGSGTMIWADDRKYCGKFKQGMQHGQGMYITPTPDGEMIYEGNWKEGKLHGLGSIKYPNGDIYEGYFKDGQCHGHGIFKQGNFLATAASIYIGEWANDQRNGYGVMDDILAGEKYMGMWQDNCRHGHGLVVTLDGVYYEGTFYQNKMTGYGLMMFEDDACYEGEFAGGGLFSGKGILRLPNGDKIEGNFNGRWSDGVKINGTFLKSSGTVNEKKTPGPNFHPSGFVPSSFGQLCVPAELKWEDIFHHCQEMMGFQGTSTKVDAEKAWESVAIMVSCGKKKLMFAEKNKLRGHKIGQLDGLERIPSHNKGSLTYEDYKEVQAYLIKAFDTPFHPLGKLMEGLVDVYRATFVGVGAHPRLLYHAVPEVRSFVKRIYVIIRILFPDLPSEGHELVVTKNKGLPSSNISEEEECEVVTSSGLILPILLPQIYPPLFTLYALYNEKEDDWYWERLMKWNKQSDIALMTYLGMDEKFWLYSLNGSKKRTMSLTNIKDLKDHYFSDAIETLQHLSTTFSPSEKLNVIRKCFEEVNKTVQAMLGEEYLWSMDDLFPVFQFVVVRARIRHLGSEINLIDDLMENHLQNGELGIMFTTLKACYFQIQNEKMSAN